MNLTGWGNDGDVGDVGVGLKRSVLRRSTKARSGKSGESGEKWKD